MENYNDVRKGQFRLILILLSGICLIMLIVTTIFEINYYNKYGFFQKTRAEVISQEEIDGVIHDVLQYEAFDVTYVVTAERESQNSVGDKLTIYFDENNPIGIIYSLDYRRIALPIITLAILLIDVLLILFYIRNNKQVINDDDTNIVHNEMKNDMNFKKRVEKSKNVPENKIYKAQKKEDN